MPQTCVIYHPKFTTHGNLVLRERLAPAYNFLMDFLKKNDRDNRVVIQIPKRVEEKLILQIHTEQHLTRVKEDDCYEAALLSAGGAVLAGKTVWLRKVKNSFVFTGTAGHHAGRNSAWGFCYINNSALLIQHLRNTYNVKRFMIIDTDPHPGDGTRDIFENDENVVHLNFCSDGHAFSEDLIKSKKFDIPLPSNISDKGFLRVLHELTPYLAERFVPEMILWNCGHDSHHADYGGFNLTTSAFPEMAKIITQVAEDICDDKLVVLLSGGSNSWVAQQSITSIVSVLADLSPPELDPEQIDENPEDIRIADNVISKLLKEVP
ncbi:MAG: histone deacetylase [Promethearchaeota archaeon]